MSENRGTYLLFLSIQRDINLTIGALGSVFFKYGNYIYIGSALGPGGLEKRVSRHLRDEKKIFWHIDYLLKNETVKKEAQGKIYSEHKIECDLVNQIISVFAEKVASIKNFGSSDCNCKSHLLFFEEMPINFLTKQIAEEMRNFRLEITPL